MYVAYETHAACGRPQSIHRRWPSIPPLGGALCDCVLEHSSRLSVSALSVPPSDCSLYTQRLSRAILYSYVTITW